jgi:hypothetical protein
MEELLAKDTNMTDSKHLPKRVLTYDHVLSWSRLLWNDEERR